MSTWTAEDGVTDSQASSFVRQQELSSTGRVGGFSEQLLRRHESASTFT